MKLICKFLIVVLLVYPFFVNAEDTSDPIPNAKAGILIEANIPQNGYKTYALRFRKPEFAYHPEIIDNRKLIARDNGILENEYLKVTLNSNGTINILDKENNHLMNNLMYYSDKGETGSAHISTEPKRNKTYTYQI